MPLTLSASLSKLNGDTVYDTTPLVFIAGGDLNAIFGLVGFIAGIMAGVFFLNKGYSLNKDQSIAIAEAGNDIFYAGGSKGANNERTFAQGLAVILYLEDKKGWAR